mmetsp:Transcript_39353/g.97201  ORF Transcript_39353/g.97201 Transcript_39353/m.97201 type:complete len:523 (+) Transcript_39353:120-1688(+)
MAGLNTYSTEPITNGKLILQTSLGPIDIELWPKEAPKACRNFVQLCLEGYYDGHMFHRVIKDFMAQTGDPTGTGEGGESVSGKPFDDEFHGRLRFNHRGLLAMANSAPNSNRSQFFLTLDKCEWLDKRHTIFGKVTGASIYNLNRFNECEVGEGDRPLYPPTILGVEVLLDPFDDIVPRQITHLNPQQLLEAKAREEAAKAKEARRPKRAKNTKLLSFGAEEEEEETIIGKGSKSERRARSVHDVLDDPRLSRELAVEPSPEFSKVQASAAAASTTDGATARAGGVGGSGGTGPAVDFAARMQQQQQTRQEQLARRSLEQREAPLAGGDFKSGAKPNSKSAPPADERAPKTSEFDDLKRQMVAGSAATGWKWRGKGGADSDDDNNDGDGVQGVESGKGEKVGKEAASELEARRARYVSKSRQLKSLGKKDRAKETALKMKMFERTVQDKSSALLSSEGGLAPPAKLMAEGSADDYVMTDPLTEQGGESAADSRAMRKIAERQGKQQLSMRADEVGAELEWRK